VSFYFGFGQSPWVAAKNGYYFQFSYNTIPEYNSLFDARPESIITSRKIKDATLQLYGEYGLSDQFTLVASIPYKILKSGDLNPNYQGPGTDIPSAENVNAFGNVQIGLKYKLLDKKWVAAGQFKIEFPAEYAKGEPSGLIPGYDAYAFSPILSIGRGWNKFYGYAWLSTIFRTDHYSDYLNGGIEGGWKPFKGFWLIIYSEVLNSFKNGSKALPPPEKQFGLYSNDLEYFSYGLKAIYDIELKNHNKLGFFIHGAGSFSGFAVAHSPLLSAGIYIKK
jgi:hypothetical protein